MLALGKHFTQAILFIAPNNSMCQGPFMSYLAKETKAQRVEVRAVLHIAGNRAVLNINHLPLPCSSPIFLSSLIFSLLYFFLCTAHTHNPTIFPATLPLKKKHLANLSPPQGASSDPCP